MRTLKAFQTNEGGSGGAPIPRLNERLDSWKEIAAFLKRGLRTVQRWEREAHLPVHRLPHEKLGSVYAYRSELEEWWAKRGAEVERDTPAEAGNGPSIAVLPFADMSQEKDQVYFCDGIAEEILQALSGVKGLRVASRTSSFQFHGAAGANSREIGRRLGVGTLLEGSVRKSGGRVRVAVQLVGAEDGFQLWAGRYDREMSDIFAIQDEIAQNIIQALEVTQSKTESQALEKRPTKDARAYDCYLRGRKYYRQYGPRDMDYALRMFLNAIEIDPSYAQAYAGLADCWSYLYLYSGGDPRVQETAEWASQKAVDIDPGSAQAQASRGLSLSVKGQDEEAERAFKTAIRLEPTLFEAHYFYARHCFSRGRKEEAIAHYEAAMKANPDDYQSPLLVAQSYEDLGRTSEAEAARRKGVQSAQRHLKMNPDDARAMYMAANGLAALGEKERSRELAERALEVRPSDSMLLYNVGCVFSLLGIPDKALECLERAYEKGLRQKGWYENDSNLDPLRELPRFQALMQALG